MVPLNKPEWLRISLQSGMEYSETRSRLRRLKLHTICEEARCPNIFECWNGGTATILLMGSTCTRGCRFCAVSKGNPHGALDVDEPERVAHALSESGLKYVVLTSVDRDDLQDGGSAHIASTVRKIKERIPDIIVEILMPDFRGDREALDRVIGSGADVLAHNVETVERLTPLIRDRRATYSQSLSLLKYLKIRSGKITKSSIMLGLGETSDEVEATMRDLRIAGVDALTLGQYLRPSPRHIEVFRYVTPDEFEKYASIAREMGFLYVASGPLVRSSYRAGEYYIEAALKEGQHLSKQGLVQEEVNL